MNALTHTITEFCTVDSSRVLVIKIKARYDEIRVVGSCVVSLFADWLNEETSAQMELAVVEGVTNVVEHAYAEDNARTLSVTAIVYADRLQVTISDNGNPIPEGVLEAATGTLIDNPLDIMNLPENGMGLFIMNGYFDDVSYESESTGVNRLHLVKQLPI